MVIYIYIYICTERETYVQLYSKYIYIKKLLYIYIYIHTRIKVTPVRAFGGSLPGQVPSETLRQQKHSDKPKCEHSGEAYLGKFPLRHCASKSTPTSPNSGCLTQFRV